MVTPAPDKRVAIENVASSFFNLSLSMMHLLTDCTNDATGIDPTLRKRYHSAFWLGGVNGVEYVFQDYGECILCLR